MRRFFWRNLAVLGMLLVWGSDGISAEAGARFQYQLYKNHENYGIVVFPQKELYPDLALSIQSLGFKTVDSGDAVMRSGTKGENETYMMPLKVQKKHSMERFIVLQILGSQEIMVGIYDPEWGLTLPSAVFQLDEVKKKIPQTLNAFRKANPLKGAQKTPLPGNPAGTLAMNILLSNRVPHYSGR